jgi:uncharacterized protein (UPF0262 family)
MSILYQGDVIEKAACYNLRISIYICCGRYNIQSARNRMERVHTLDNGAYRRIVPCLYIFCQRAYERKVYMDKMLRRLSYYNGNRIRSGVYCQPDV